MCDILAVDDSPGILMMVDAYLSTNGHRVHTAEDAVEAIGLIRSGQPPNILLTDIVMPGDMDGIGLAQFVRDNYPHVGILLMTGWSYDDTHGFEVLEKPFELVQLRTWVDTYCSDHGLS